MKTFSNDAMYRKRQLAACIGEAVAGNGWSQREAARHLGISQSKLSNMLRGRFEGVGELKLLNCLVLLGYDVRIGISRSHHGAHGELSLEIV